MEICRRGINVFKQKTMNKYNPQIHHRRSIRLKGYDYSQAGLYFITICCEDRICRFGNVVGAGLAPALEQNGQPNNIIGQPQGLPQRIAPTDAHMVLNEFGQIAYNEWGKLAERFPNFELDVFQIMPNHMHGIIALKNVGAGFTPAQNESTDKSVGAGFTPAQNTPAQNTQEQPYKNTGQPQSQEGQPQGLPQRLPQRRESMDETGATARGAPTTTVSDIVGAYKSLVANECLKIWKLKWAGENDGVTARVVPTMGKFWQRNYHEHIIRNEQSYETISNYIINNPAKWKEDKFYNQ